MFNNFCINEVPCGVLFICLHVLCYMTCDSLSGYQYSRLNHLNTVYFYYQILTYRKINTCMLMFFLSFLFTLGYPQQTLVSSIVVKLKVSIQQHLFMRLYPHMIRSSLIVHSASALIKSAIRAIVTYLYICIYKTYP